MKTDPQSGVVVLASAIPQADGDTELLEALRDIGDRSSGSEELRRRAWDWSSRYELSPSRANLLRALSFEPGMRVLEVGAGTGALSRYLGEQGAEVVALEGDLARARVAQARCADLPNVTVMCGPVTGLMEDAGFDVVLLCGMHGHADPVWGNGDAPSDLLEQARAQLKADGALVLAVANQLGLKYLMGYPEDRSGRAFVGLEGYPDGSRTKACSRRILTAMLNDAGVPIQRWLYPFPDHRLPVVVLADRLYVEPDATDIVDQVIRNPAREELWPPVMRADGRRLHRSFLDAGLGRDVANSFLVVAAASDAGVDSLVDHSTLLWRFGEQRRSVWMRTTTVADSGNTWLARQARTYPESGAPEMGFLRQSVTSERPYYRGRTLEQKILTAFGQNDYAGARSVLCEWRDELRKSEYSRSSNDASHPFLLDESTCLLPATYLDVSLDNFVDTGDGLHYIDDEWELPAGIDVRLAVVRALWWFAEKVIQSGTNHPWSSSISVDNLAVVLGAWCGEAIDEDLLRLLLHAEAELQAIVADHSVEGIFDELTRVGSVDRVQLGLRGHQTEGLVAHMERELAAARAELANQQETKLDFEALEAELDARAALCEDLNAQLSEALAERDQSQVSHANAVATLEVLRNRLPMRVYLRTRDLFQQLVRSPRSDGR